MSNGASKVVQPVMRPEPDWETVRQYEPPQMMKTVPVKVEGIVTGQALPAKRGIGRTFTITSQTVEIIPADPRIKNAIVFCSNNVGTCFMGTLSQLTGNGSGAVDGFQLSAFQSYPPFEGFQEAIYAVGIGGNSTVSVWLSYWAD